MTVEAEEIRSMQLSLSKLAKAEEEKRMIKRENEKLLDEVKRAQKELGEAREKMERSEREKREMSEKMDRMRMMMKTEWSGTESLHIVDGTVHALSPTTLTQIVGTPEDKPWRTAFTLPIDEGEWELKIRASEKTFSNVKVGFLNHPLPYRGGGKNLGGLLVDSGTI
ncbi:hypothetical protein BLNAU_10988 [Blattamonas nauphoetae]|uniref:Uncharacterized protein n=1 Tax=Blattamonas nauphoetae TaxID=2049346 RepID=A0ABQ9XSW4_9EUKA|nr:hypothetical protein BLNAU_10988 [Blattamonas nauphoetae]